MNVVDSLNSGSPSQQACDEFLAGDIDGESGGLGACHLAESVGYSYSTIVRGGISMCLIKSLPSTKNVKSGGVTINSGTLPAGGIEQLFSTPSGSTPRIVKVSVTGGMVDDNKPKIIYVEVPAKSDLDASKNYYQANLWFCDEAGTTLRGYDNLSFSSALKFISNNTGFTREGISSSIVSGQLAKSGNKLVWNTALSRFALASRVDDNGKKFKSNLEITKANFIKLNRYDIVEDRNSKGYLVTKFTGNNAESLKFLSGAYKEIHRDRPFTSASEYQGPFYAIDTNNTLLDDVDAVSLDTEFYNTDPQVDFDTNKYSCATVPDISVTMDVGNETVKSSAGQCDKQDLENMHFCHDDPEVKQAEENFKQKCAAPPPTPRPPKMGPPPRP